MRVTVLVSTSVHPLSGLPRRSRNDATAMEMARNVPDAEVTVLHAGDPSDTALRDYLALGAAVVHVAPAQPGDDLVHALLPHVGDAHLVLTGLRAEGGHSSGMLPYLIAAHLRRPVIAGVLALEPAAGCIRALQFLPKGKRRRVEAQLPVVIAVHPMAPLRPRYAYARLRAGRVGVLPGSPQPDADANAWTWSAATLPPKKHEAMQRQSGHARMLSAVAMDAHGGRVVRDGSEVEKAQVLLSYLQDHGYADLRSGECQ
jgi:electron transfer flavoprotein beta subunit